LQVLLEIGDEFIDSCIEFGCRMARHRKARKLEVQDIQFHLGREYNIHIPGFSSDAIRMDRLRNELKVAATNGAGPAGGTRVHRLAAVAQARVQLQQQAKKAAATTTVASTGGVGLDGGLTVPAPSKVAAKS
jgi:transcription initiation factor TFIID subunit TAF12